MEVIIPVFFGISCLVIAAISAFSGKWDKASFFFLLALSNYVMIKFH